MADLDWKTDAVRFQQIERQLHELGALVRGQVPTVSARIADCLEQVSELRKELVSIQERQDKMADFIRSHVKEHKNGGTNGPA